MELTGDTQDERDKALKRLKTLVGKDAGKHLYVTEAYDSKGKAHYYVESDKNLGDVGGGKLGGFISQIIGSNKGVEYKIATNFDTRFENGVSTSSLRCGGACTVGAEESNTGNTQIFVHPDSGNKTQMIFNTYGVGAGKFTGGAQLDFYDDIDDAHEFGHAYANAIEGKPIRNSGATNARSLEFENLQRDTYTMKARRTAH